MTGHWWEGSLTGHWWEGSLTSFWKIGNVGVAQAARESTVGSRDLVCRLGMLCKSFLNPGDNLAPQNGSAVE